MSLNLGMSGDFKPYVKFNAKADKWFVPGENGDQEIGRPTFVADFRNIATGWLLFAVSEIVSTRSFVLEEFRCNSCFGSNVPMPTLPPPGFSNKLFPLA